MPSTSTSPAPSRLRLGLRREATILLPISSLALVALTLFTLVAYRSFVLQQTERERERALDTTQRLSEALQQRASGLDDTDLAGLRRLWPGLGAITLLDGDGVPVRSTGDPVELAAPRGDDSRTLGPTVLGPDRQSGGAIVVWLPVGEDRILRADFPRPLLAAQRRSLPWLAGVVLSISAALVVLFVVFLRHWLEPFESLLERAREVRGESPMEPDEVRFLVDTFDRALHSMRSDAPDEPEIEALQRTLTADLEGGLLILDPDRRVLAVNEAGRQLLDLEDDIVDSQLEAALARHPELVRLLEQLSSGTGAAVRQEATVSIDRTERTLGLNVHPLRKSDGSVRAWLVLFGDATSLHHELRQKQVARSLGQLGELTAGVAHEMRNSLATLRGYLTLLERDPEAEVAREYIAEIRHEADQQQRVLEDFLAFARPGSSRSEPIDLERLLRRAAADPVLEERGAAVDIQAVAGDRISILGDGSLLERAFRNLLHNAALAQVEAGSGEPIEVRIDRQDDRARVAVLDRGPGLDPKMLDRLFVPFASTRPGGVGLGLALSHRIVELHGGQLQVSNRPGGGVQAETELPLDTSATERNSRPG